MGSLWRVNVILALLTGAAYAATPSDSPLAGALATVALLNALAAFVAYRAAR